MATTRRKRKKRPSAPLIRRGIKGNGKERMSEAVVVKNKLRL